MRKGVCRSIILTYTGSEILRKWTEIGFEEYVAGEGVCLIEWANLIEEILPEERTEILIEKDLEQGFDFRRITVTEKK
mgnify:CR=1 FL=1